MMKPYFKARGDQPAPLRVSIERTVRFEEVDSLGIVWHGRYASYFEDARVAVGQKYGIGYMDFYSHGVIAPIKKMHFDYYRSLRFWRMRIRKALNWNSTLLLLTGKCHFSRTFRLRAPVIMAPSSALQYEPNGGVKSL